MPARLSGGQAHRVALGRLLLAHCDALLLDEPYTGLDAGLRRTLTSLVGDLVDRTRQSRRCWSRTSWPTRRPSPTGWPSSTRASCCRSGRPPRSCCAPRPAGSPSWSATWASCPSGGPARPGPATPAWWPASIPSGSSPGAHPDRGVVLTGIVTGGRPSGAVWEADLRIGGREVTCRLADRPGAAGDLVVTALDPPCFGPDGAAAADPRPARPGPPGPGPCRPARDQRAGRGAAPAPRLRLARQARGFSQQQLAGMAGDLPPGRLGGRVRACPTPRCGWRWPSRHALGLTVEELFGPGSPAPLVPARPLAPLGTAGRVPRGRSLALRSGDGRFVAPARCRGATAASRARRQAAGQAELTGSRA